MALYKGGQFDPNDPYDNYVYDESTKNYSSNSNYSSGGSLGHLDGSNTYCLILLALYWWPAIFILTPYIANGPLSFKMILFTLPGLAPIICWNLITKRRKWEKPDPLWLTVDTAAVWALFMGIISLVD